MSVSSAKIDFWINNNCNIMFVGRHGVGKTAIIKEAFDRHQLKWRYFSASTMDPWVDFIGVPREKTEDVMPESFLTIRELAKINQQIAISYVMQNWKLDADSANEVVQHASKPAGTTYLELIRPFSFAKGEVEALFFDEFNRSPKKIRNAVMELIQFGSVNGHKFPNLRFVWCAINPDDDELLKYDVEVCDPAHLDRFHCSIPIPYKPNAEWFREQYGQRFADSAIQWWDDLSEEVKNTVSPRRLQYALDMFTNKGDIRDVLPVASNVGKLITSLKNGPITEQIEELVKTKDKNAATKFLENENNFAAAIKFIVQSVTLLEYFAPLMPQEKIASLMATEDKICNHIIKNLDKVPAFHKISKQVMSANLDAGLVKKIRRALTEDENLAKAFAQDTITVPQKSIAPHFSKRKVNWTTELAQLNSMVLDSGPQRIAVYEKIIKSIPEKITAEEALDTLKLLNEIFGNEDNVSVNNQKDKWLFASIIIDPSFDKLFGIINHCLIQIHKEKNLSLTQIINNYNIKSYEIFKKIIETDMIWKLPSEDFSGITK
jgi:MoxR-like ATPase